MSLTNDEVSRGEDEQGRGEELEAELEALNDKQADLQRQVASFDNAKNGYEELAKWDPGPDGIDDWAQQAVNEDRNRDARSMTWGEICEMKQQQAMEVAASWDGCDDEGAPAEAEAVREYNEYWK